MNICLALKKRVKKLVGCRDGSVAGDLNFISVWLTYVLVHTEDLLGMGNFNEYLLLFLVCDGFVSKNVHKKGRYFNVKIPLKYFAY